VKYAEIPKDDPIKKQVEIPDENWFSCKAIAQMILHKYPHLSIGGQVRTVQNAAQTLRTLSEIKLKKYGYTKDDVTPRRTFKTPIYTRKGAIAILEIIGYGVINVSQE
jgi:hypothetical protein